MLCLEGIRPFLCQAAGGLRAIHCHGLSGQARSGGEQSQQGGDSGEKGSHVDPIWRGGRTGWRRSSWL